ncbi:MAG: hypothetical protein ACK4GR_04820 [bacterium]
MYYFPLELFQSIIEFAIKSKSISKQKIKKVKDFFKALNNLPSERIKEIQKSDYISEIFSKDEFMELYALYINNNDKVIKDIFGEISIVDIEEMKIDFDFLAELNSKIKKIIEKNAAFLVKAGPEIYLIIPFPFDRYLYFDIKNLVGEYAVLLGYPYDVFEVCQKILLKIREKEIKGFLLVSSQNFLKKADLIPIEEKKHEENKYLEIKLYSSKFDKIDSVPKSKLSQIVKKKKFFLIGSPASNDYNTIKAFVSEGVEAIKLHTNIVHPVSKQKIGSFNEEKEKILQIILDYPGILWGLVPGNLTTNPECFEEIDLLELENYFDFIDLFHHSYTLHYLSYKNDKMVAIDKVFSKSEMEVIEKHKFVAIEASIVDKNYYGMPLTLEDIINYKKIVENTEIPVFVSTQKKILPSHVPFLYNIGVKGIVLGQISTSFDPDNIKRTVNKFLEEIRKL